jgi:hypothetical protein
MARGGKRLGAGRKRGGQDDPKKALAKAADRIAAELAIAIAGDITALGKDRLTELDNMAMQLVKVFAPKETATLERPISQATGDDRRQARGLVDRPAGWTAKLVAARSADQKTGGGAQAGRSGRPQKGARQGCG